MLERAGPTQVKGSASWSPGGRHYLIRGGTPIFCPPNQIAGGAVFRLGGAHTDNPNLRIRPQPNASNLS
ncbi:MAG TPA: hypothetical protein VNF24_03375 [Candidatus Acidoferrales bacterium]|nr:hypothetical protein [Candidatus Acidoferrales bacterium]